MSLIGYPARIFLITHVLLYHTLAYPDRAGVVPPGPKRPVLTRHLPPLGTVVEHDQGALALQPPMASSCLES